jgi:glycosyltransferase involved in cell wall biosynthesis
MPPAQEKAVLRLEMRIWLVDPIGYTGMAYYDWALASGLREEAVDVSVITSDAWMLNRRMPRFRIRHWFTQTHRGSRVVKGIHYLKSLTRFTLSALRERPDVIHWQYLELPIADLLAMYWIRLLGIPQFYTAHEMLPWNASGSAPSIFGRIYRLMDGVFVHHEQDRVELRRDHRVDPGRVFVIGHGAYKAFATPELSQEEARRRLGLPSDAPIALFFGSIRPQKGLDVLMRAWAEVVVALPKAHLLVVGKPYKGMDAAAIVQAVGTDREHHVSLRFEQVSPAETNLYYRAADIVVLPYLQIVTSGVLRYAYSSGRGVVATAVGEHRELVVSGETGLLVAPADPKPLTDALVSVLSDTDLCARFGHAAWLLAESQMDWSDTAARVASVYAAAVNRRRNSQ